jgi:outer membrane immunogenic protein
MRKLVLAAISMAALFSTGAAAADLRVARPAAPAPVVIPAPDWTGAYAGINAGYAWGSRDGFWDCLFICGGDDFDYDQNGGLIGAQAGFNYQFGMFVAGVEVDGDVANIKGDMDLGTGKYNWLATATGKLGLAFDSFMIYGKAGYGVAGFEFNGAFGCNFSDTNSGLVLGAGAEVKLTARTSVKAEYNHIKFDRSDSFCSSFGVIPTFIERDGSLDIAKVGLNYHFGK